MGRSHRMPPGLQDHLAHRTVGRNRIAARQDGAEEKPAVGIGDETRPRRRTFGLISRLLRIVEAVVVGVPDVHRHPRQRSALEVGDTALHEHALARQLGRDVGAVRHRLVLADIERAEHGRLGGAIALAMVDRIDQHRNPEYVRQQDELLPGRAAFLPDAGQKIDRIPPFVEAEIGLADEIVQRLHQFFHQEFDPRVGRLLKTADDGGGEFGVVELGHRSILE